MLRLLLGASVTLALLFPLMAQDQKEKTEPKKDRSERFGEIRREFSAQMKEFFEARRNVKSQEEFVEAAKKRPDPKKYIPKLLDLVEDNPKDELSREILVFSVQSFGPEAKKAIKYLTDAHASHESLAQLARIIGSQPFPTAKPLMEKILEKNQSREAKGFAAFGLANLAFESLDDQTLDAAVRKETQAEAVKYFTLISKEYAELEFGGARKTSLGDMAKRYLFDLQHLQVGMTAPEVIAETLDGSKEKLSDYKGKVVVLDVWATWCGPCRAMIPHEREMVTHLKNKPFALISISADAEKSTLEEFLKTESMPWKHWWVGNESGFTVDWNIRFFPTIYVIDGKGVIRHKNLRDKELEAAVEKLLEETTK